MRNYGILQLWDVAWRELKSLILQSISYLLRGQNLFNFFFFVHMVNFWQIKDFYLLEKIFTRFQWIDEFFSVLLQ